jgi:hypothetical protein
MKHKIYIILTFFLLFQGCGSDEKKKESTPEVSEDNNIIDLPINPSFSKISRNIVKEEQSNLYWQDNLEAKTTIKKFADAKNYCASLTLDEIDSWRLPTYKELLTLVDYKKETPAVNDEFVNTDSKEYWTQSKRNATKDLYRWTIHFKRGVVHFQTGAYPSSFSTQHNVRCVSDSFANKRIKESNFVKNEDIVTDNINNLLWQDTRETKTIKRSFANSDSYCDNLSLAQYNSGWRVPTTKELSSLINLLNDNPAIANAFTNTAYNDAYWSNDKQAKLDSSQWNINFKDGVINLSGKNNASFNQYVRCVREK